MAQDMTICAHTDVLPASAVQLRWTHGKEKATAELGLSFLAYNLKRALNMIGANKLIAAMQ